MPIWKAILLGVIQGAAEFLPVSSSGHLVIMKEILDVDLAGGGVFFDVMLHLGTLLAIFVAIWQYWSDISLAARRSIGRWCAALIGNWWF